jgi:hypothetical protein
MAHAQGERDEHCLVERLRWRQGADDKCLLIRVTYIDMLVLTYCPGIAFVCSLRLKRSG